MTSFMSSGAMFGVGVVVAALAIMRYLLAKPKGRLPPGPKGLPLVGNIMDLPRPGRPEHLHWVDLSKKYGPICSVTVFGLPIIILNDHAMTIELLEKRGNIYSERPEAFFSSELCGWKPFIGAQGLTPLMRAYRRDIHGAVGSRSSLNSKMPVMEAEGKRYLVRAMQQPDEFVEHLKKYTGAIILNIAYGYNVAQDGPDPLVDLAVMVLGGFVDSIIPGKWMVDIFHWLQYIPSWFPGAGFKKTAAKYSKLTWDGSAVPMKFTEARIEEGRAEDCMVTDLLAKVDPKTKSQADYDRIMRSAAALYAAGADTTMATLKWFFICMIKHPEAQRKAQEEIDRVVGVERVPVFADRDRLPYIDAIWQEVMRWNSIGQMGLPHAVLQEDEVRGYRIPKGSMILTHTGLYLHDPKVYKDPEQFRPERFLGSNPEPHPEKSGQFGYGRRVCPGRGLADQSGWLVIAQTLSAFNIRHKKDQNGRDIEVPMEGMEGLIYSPKPYVMDLEPRSQKHAEMIKDIGKGLKWEQGDAEELKKMGILGSYRA